MKKSSGQVDSLAGGETPQRGSLPVIRDWNAYVAMLIAEIIRIVEHREPDCARACIALTVCVQDGIDEPEMQAKALDGTLGPRGYDPLTEEQSTLLIAAYMRNCVSYPERHADGHLVEVEKDEDEAYFECTYAQLRDEAKYPAEELVREWRELF